MEYTPEETAKKIEFALKQRRIDIPELSERSGMSKSVLYKLIRQNNRPFYLQELIAVSRGLGVSMDFFVGLRVKFDDCQLPFPYNWS